MWGKFNRNDRDKSYIILPPYITVFPRKLVTLGKFKKSAKMLQSPRHLMTFPWPLLYLSYLVVAWGNFWEKTVQKSTPFHPLNKIKSNQRKFTWWKLEKYCRINCNLYQRKFLLNFSSFLRCEIVQTDLNKFAYFKTCRVVKEFFNLEFFLYYFLNSARRKISIILEKFLTVFLFLLFWGEERIFFFGCLFPWSFLCAMNFDFLREMLKKFDWIFIGKLLTWLWLGCTPSSGVYTDFSGFNSLEKV